MAGYWKDDRKGENRWTIRIPDGQPAEPTAEQRELIARFPEINPDALSAFMGQFQTTDELEEFLKNFPKPQEPGDTASTTEDDQKEHRA
jgi:hypothetical protein